MDVTVSDRADVKLSSPLGARPAAAFGPPSKHDARAHQQAYIPRYCSMHNGSTAGRGRVSGILGCLLRAADESTQGKMAESDTCSRGNRGMTPENTTQSEEVLRCLQCFPNGGFKCSPQQPPLAGHPTILMRERRKLGDGRQRWTTVWWP
jgi:hypothetical protein